MTTRTPPSTSSTDQLRSAYITKTQDPNVVSQPRFCTECSEVSHLGQDSSECTVCNSIFHFRCSDIATRDKWVKLPVDRRGKWKCSTCKGTATNLSREVDTLSQRLKAVEVVNAKILDQNRTITQTLQTLQEAILNLPNQIAAASTKIPQMLPNLTSETVCDPPETKGLSQPSEYNKILSDHSTVEEHKIHNSNIINNPPGHYKLPRYLEELVSEIPQLETNNPWSILSFISELYDINLTSPEWFNYFFKTVSIKLKNPVLMSILNHQNSEEVSFKKISEHLIDQHIDVRTKTYLISRKVLRTQQGNEPFRKFVHEIKKYSTILGNYDPDDILDIILSGVNLQTRARFQFTQRPQDMCQLETLVLQVERLEASGKAENYSRNFSKYFATNNYRHKQVPHAYTKPNSPSNNSPNTNIYEHKNYIQQQTYQTPNKKTYYNSKSHDKRADSQIRMSQNQAHAFRLKNPNWSRRFSANKKIQSETKKNVHKISCRDQNNSSSENEDQILSYDDMSDDPITNKKSEKTKHQEKKQKN